MTLRAIGRAAPASVLAALVLAACGGSASRHATAASEPSAAPVPSDTRATPRRAEGRRVAARRVVTAKKPRAKEGEGFTPVATGNGKALRGLAASVTRAAGAGQVGPARHPVHLRVHFASVGRSDQESFVSAADGICSSYRATVRRIGASASTLPAQENEMQDLMDATSASLKALRSLSPPASAAGLAGRYASLLTESVDDYILAQARSGSADEATGAASEAQDLTLANASGHDALEAKAVARRVGFRVCGSDGAEWL